MFEEPEWEDITRAAEIYSGRVEGDLREAFELLFDAPEEDVRDALRLAGECPSRQMELHWLTPQLVHSLNEGQVVTITPVKGCGRLLWSAFKPGAKRAKHKTPWLATEPKP
ncbi:hypothetical protein [Desulfolutivibrio sulfoxidireducens]|uniref:hypothetical protein n=1 Tax=Desulfolutivibrio sulfoxidireducens TaxID=2773299 RepID=UPI00159D3DE0|nr:hypothetical protein [Desulfolutivibrio sulfoxidireducens]QLA21247.1 hypothetical protein GD604_16710 [Desulfolutivibrio sulfoxidireducens]